MAQIELRHCEIDMLDGLSGTAILNDTSAGVLTGAYLYRYTFVDASGETNGGAEASSITLNAQQAKVTLGLGPTGTTARKLYRTVAGGASGSEKLVATINDNTTTVYIDNIADGSLGAVVPTTNTTTVTPPTAPTVAVGAAGVLTGAYLYKITFVNAAGETNGGTESASVSPSAQQISLTNIPLGGAGVTARKIYRTAAGGASGSEKLVTTLNDNTTTSYTDNTADTSLGVVVPTTNTTTIAPPAAPVVIVNPATVTATDTTGQLSSVALNTKVTTQVPVGARFQMSTAGNTTVFTVQSRTPASGPTTSITFSPAFGTPTPVDGDTLNFLPQKLSIKIGEGDIKFTEKKDYQYVLDRGNLDTVRENNQVPMEVAIDFLYQFITTGTSEALSPVDALKNEGTASEWVTASSDPCEPYCVDIRLVHTPPCTNEIETVLFPDFRRDQVQYDPKAATINITGKCNAMEPVVTRSVTAPI